MIYNISEEVSMSKVLVAFQIDKALQEELKREGKKMGLNSLKFVCV